MTCAAILCFMGLFADGSIDRLRTASPAFGWELKGDNIKGWSWTEVYRDRQQFGNPYGTLALGAAWTTPSERVQVELSLQHQSSFKLRDRGEDSARLKVRVWLLRGYDYDRR